MSLEARDNSCSKSQAAPSHQEFKIMILCGESLGSFENLLKMKGFLIWGSFKYDKDSYMWCSPWSASVIPHGT